MTVEEKRAKYADLANSLRPLFSPFHYVDDEYSFANDTPSDNSDNVTCEVIIKAIGSKKIWGLYDSRDLYSESERSNSWVAYQMIDDESYIIVRSPDYQVVVDFLVDYLMPNKS